METITITLNGVEVSGYTGMSILDLARESGVDIPTLCHDSNINPYGACRLCLVEDEHAKVLLTACVTPLRPQMVINTRSPRVLERRKTIIELMLASHPDSCLVCDKGNRCQLRKLAADMGIGRSQLHRIPHPAVIEEVNPFIERDLSKCILCAKCIRADQELVVEGALDYIGRGFASKPATLNDVPLEKSECTFCGTCVALCPTGALMEKERIYRGTTTTAIDTICPFCGCGCAITLEVKDNLIVRARPAAKSPVNRGTLCVKGAYGYDFVHSTERLTVPLIRVNGGLQEASWEQALDLVATQLKKIREDYGSDSLAILGSSKCTNEENYLLQRLARAVLGTNNIDNGSRLYSSPTRVGLGSTIGSAGTTNSLDELERSPVIVVIGADPATSAPVVAYAIKRAVKYKGTKLILIDPRPTKLASFAYLWLRPKPGTDVALINGLSRLIIEEKLFDEEFVARRTDNFSELRQSLKTYTPEHAEKITGIPGQDIQLAARTLAAAERASIVYGNGITQQTAGTDGVIALANMAMLTGNTGHQGGGIFALQRENNAQGACDMGSLPDFLPGYQAIDDPEARKAFEDRWQTSLPTNTGLSALEMMEQVKGGKIKGMLIVGENPALAFPASSQVKKILASLQFLAVADMFLTETAKLATVVLPSASFAEKEGTFTNFEGRVQRLRIVIEPVGNCLPDWQIMLKLADKMGKPMPYSSPQQVMDEILELVPLYQHLAYADLEAEDLAWADLESGHLGARLLYKGPFPSGFGRFYSVRYKAPAVSQDGYPLTLVSGSVLPHFGTGSRTLRAPRLKKFSAHAWVETSAVDAKRLELSAGDKVKVISPEGEVNTTVRMNDALPAGMLFMPISFPDSPVNDLFALVLDPQAKTPALKRCAVRLERIDSDG